MSEYTKPAPRRKTLRLEFDVELGPDSNNQFFSTPEILDCVYDRTRGGYFVNVLQVQELPAPDASLRKDLDKLLSELRQRSEDCYQDWEKVKRLSKREPYRKYWLRTREAQYLELKYVIFKLKGLLAQEPAAAQATKPIAEQCSPVVDLIDALVTKLLQRRGELSAPVDKYSPLIDQVDRHIEELKRRHPPTQSDDEYANLEAVLKRCTDAFLDRAAPVYPTATAAERETMSEQAEAAAAPGDPVEPETRNYAAQAQLDLLIEELHARKPMGREWLNEVLRQGEELFKPATTQKDCPTCAAARSAVGRLLSEVQTRSTKLDERYGRQVGFTHIRDATKAQRDELTPVLQQLSVPQALLSPPDDEPVDVTLTLHAKGQTESTRDIGLNLKRLKEQKHFLEANLQSKEAEGLLNFLDAIQDYLVDDAGLPENDVFDLDDEETNSSDDL